MKILKKNQVILYTVALMLVVAAYLNFSSTGDLKKSAQVSSSEEELVGSTNIGDAQLVSSNDVVANNDVNSAENKTNNNTENILNNEENIENNSLNTSSNVENKKNRSGYFASSKLNRDNMYSQMIETYQNILDSNNSSETQKQSASEEINKINGIKNSIMICENLLKTKGFENNVIFVNGNSISIIVGAEELKQEQVAQIQNIISREMNAEAKNIHISNK